MSYKRILISLVLIPSVIFPITMTEADIYISSRGTGQIVASLNETMISGDENLDSTFFVIRTSEELKDPMIFSRCTNRQKVVVREAGKGAFLYGIFFKTV